MLPHTCKMWYEFISYKACPEKVYFKNWHAFCKQDVPFFNSFILVSGSLSAVNLWCQGKISTFAGYRLWAKRPGPCLNSGTSTALKSSRLILEILFRFSTNNIMTVNAFTSNGIHATVDDHSIMWLVLKPQQSTRPPLRKRFKNVAGSWSLWNLGLSQVYNKT